MHPRLISTPYFTLHTFGVLLAPAFVAAAHFLLEYFRGDADRGFLFGGLLSTS